MKTLEINISRTDIDRELSKITAYTGVKSPIATDLKTFDRIATVDEDAALLDRYWQTAANTLADRLKDFITAYLIGNDSLALTLEVSGAFDDSLTPSIAGDIRDYMTADMLRAWFAITLPDRVSDWHSEADRLLRDLSRKLHHRRPPRRIPTDP